MDHENASLHDDKFGVDANGRLTRLTQVNGAPVLIHYDDIPDSDITIHHGVPVTTALRTTIDLAVELSAAELEEMVEYFMSSGFFTADEAFVRIAEPDMVNRRGAHILQALLVRRRLRP